MEKKVIVKGDLIAGDYGILGISWSETGDVHFRLLKSFPTPDELIEASNTIIDVANWMREQN